VPDSRMGEKAVPNFPYNEVAAVHLKAEGAEVNLVRKNDVWRVQERGDYPADFHKLSDALIKIRDLKVVQSEPVAPSQLAQVNLLEPGKGRGSGVLAEFKDAQGKLLVSLMLGKPHMPEQKKGSPFAPSSDGRYVLLATDPQNALLVSDALSSLSPKPENWLSQDFIKVDHVKSVSRVAPESTNTWTVSRNTEESPWVLANAKPGEKLNDALVNGITGSMTVSIMKDVVPNPDLAATGLDKPETLTFETFDHFVYSLKVGGKAPDGNRFMQVNVTADIPAGSDETTVRLREKLKQDQAFSPWVYVVGSWVIDPMLRSRSGLMVDPKAAVEEVNALPFHEPPPASAAPAADDPFSLKK